MGEWITISDRDLDELAELTDERIEMLAERFRERGIHNLTGATFERYLASPGYYDAVVERLRAGFGLRIEAAESGGVRVAVVRLEAGRVSRLSRIASALRAGWQAARAA